ncbi:hypothetical protein DMI70_14375 [Escherichia coli]|nr:hypothetical protein [Escherichia coli]
MAFRLMRYATAAMQRHRTKAMTESRWWYHCCFIMAKPRPTRTHSTGWMSLTIRNLPGSCTPKLFRWWISPSYLTMRIMQHRRIALLELIQKHIRDRDLIGMVDRITTLLVRGFTNDSQLQTLFNYLLQCGDTSRFTRFIQEIAERSPLQRRD